MTLTRTALMLSLAVAAHCAIAADGAQSNSKPANIDAANLLKNPGFEATNGRGGAAQWINKQHAGVRAYEFSVVETPRRTGKHSMMIRRLKKQVWGKTEQIVPVDAKLAGETVEFEIWVRGEQLGEKGYMMRVGAFAGSSLLDFAKSDRFVDGDEWTKHTLRLKVPEYTNQIVVAVTLEDEGTIWMDDARLRVVAQP